MKSTKAAIKQTAPFRSKSQEALITLFLTVDRIRAVFTRFLEPHDLTTQQYNVLRILRGAEPEGLPTLGVAGRMIERAPGITRMIDRLEGKGLVIRERRGVDRRCVHCRISASGLKLLGGLDAGVNELDAQVLRVLTRKELDQLVSVLTRIRVANESPEPGGVG